MVHGGSGLPGFGAGLGTSAGAGGGGLGAGGDIFVQQGAILTIDGGVINGGTVTGGKAGGSGPAGRDVDADATSTAGQGMGAGIFLQGNQTLSLGDGLAGDGRAGDGLAEVVWVGRREVDCARHPQPRKVSVRVAAGAFGPGLPHTDLWLSPDHSVYVEEVLIPVKYLINGSTIAQVPVDSITYHHIELAQHDVLLAEGLPVESYLDIRDGRNYPDRAAAVRLYPDYTARMWEAFGCARLVITGPELQAARALVAEVAGGAGGCVTAARWAYAIRSTSAARAGPPRSCGAAGITCTSIARSPGVVYVQRGGDVPRANSTSFGLAGERGSAAPASAPVRRITPAPGTAQFAARQRRS